MHRGVLTILLQIIGDLFQAPAPSLTEMRSMITGSIQSIWYYIFPPALSCNRRKQIESKRVIFL